MYGIALWKNKDCLGSPDLVIGWRPNIKGVQIADLVHVNLVMNVGSWMDLESKNGILQAANPPGFIYDAQQDRNLYHENGEWTVLSGESSTTQAAVKELTEAAAEIQAAYGQSDGGISDEVLSTLANPRSHGGFDDTSIQSLPGNGSRDPNLFDEHVSTSWMNQAPAENLAPPGYNPSIQLQNNYVPQLTPHLYQPLDENIARLARKLGRLQPMVPVRDAEKQIFLLEQYLFNQGSPGFQEPAGGLQNLVAQIALRNNQHDPDVLVKQEDVIKQEENTRQEINLDGDLLQNLGSDGMRPSDRIEEEYNDEDSDESEDALDVLENYYNNVVLGKHGDGSTSQAQNPTQDN
ncbi:hypothetical protein ABW20_dc0110544 [Dactylellina cionopaga]|nr:hypothetical protein ABW20_dc0110544 [Dactylellina cionopaga]